ncbi:CBS domain-containing protein [Caballeronia sp. DA-9]|uniref:CBS domain-containing protein n=1 Tax=Caballeronia sp. DA-9 TaxID=3436237 RepID=UPI003F6769F0
MTTDVVTISPDAPLDELVRLMASHKVKRVLVIENGKLVGVVARADLMRALLKALPDTQSASTNDEKIRQGVIAGLAKQPWSGLVRVDVHLGIVDLSGIIFDEHAREAARVLAENVPGVRLVTDQLAWVEPISGVYPAAAPATDI